MDHGHISLLLRAIPVLDSAQLALNQGSLSSILFTQADHLLLDEYFDYFTHWQPDYVGVGSINAFYQKCSKALDGISASLVKGFVAADVPLDFVGSKFFEGHLCASHIGNLPSSFFTTYGITSIDLMGLAAELLQHAAGRGLPPGFA